MSLQSKSTKVSNINKLNVTLDIKVYSNKGFFNAKRCSILRSKRPITGFWWKFHNKTYLVSEKLWKSRYSLVNKFEPSLYCFSLYLIVS